MSQTEIESALYDKTLESWASPVQPRIEKMASFITSRLINVDQELPESDQTVFDQIAA